MSAPETPQAALQVALNAAIAHFLARQPPRIWSLIVSFLGDAMLPRGGVVQAGTISEFCGIAGIDAGLVRTALSRLVAKNIVAREREGRKSFYRLTMAERRAFEAAASLIYGRTIPVPDGGWQWLLIDQCTARAEARSAAQAAGYVAYGPATLLRPHHLGRDAPALSGALALDAALPNPAQEAARLWPLVDLKAGYQRFLARYALFAQPCSLPSDAALLARVLLVHDYRRIVLRDPFLPGDALPGDWPGNDARGLFDTAHAALTPAAETWLTERP